MEKMKHQDGYAPSAEDTAKLNEIVTWLVDHGYEGLVLIHKGDVGISWCRESSADDIRHVLINSIAHIADESFEIAADLAKGVLLAAQPMKNLRTPLVISVPRGEKS